MPMEVASWEFPGELIVVGRAPVDLPPTLQEQDLKTPKSQL